MRVKFLVNVMIYWIQTKIEVLFHRQIVYVPVTPHTRGMSVECHGKIS